jgi:DNA-binding LacI/PurR family transcriptional regulator
MAGVSQSAVSRAFRPGGSIAPATLARIRDAAEALGYRPNAFAQGLITRRTQLVAVVISNLTNLHYPEVLAELTQRLSARGSRVLLFTLSSESEIDAVLDQVWRYRVDGAVVAARLSDPQIAEFGARGTALVLYNREAAGAASVACEFAEGAARLVDGLVASGARAFGVVAGPPDSVVGEARVAGAVARLAALGIADVPMERGDFGYATGRDAANRLLERPLDAIIAANDVMALGALDAARHDRGLSVPADLAVVGFDGVAPAAWASYQLTTIRQPADRMTEAAIELLFTRIDDPAAPPEQRRFTGDLIPGATATLKEAP